MVPSNFRLRDDPAELPSTRIQGTQVRDMVQAFIRSLSRQTPISVSSSYWLIRFDWKLVDLVI
jgi:hypothetical protein